MDLLASTCHSRGSDAYLFSLIFVVSVVVAANSMTTPSASLAPKLAATPAVKLAKVDKAGATMQDIVGSIQRVSDIDLQMRVVWENGRLLVDETLADIRARAALHLEER